MSATSFQRYQEKKMGLRGQGDAERGREKNDKGNVVK